MNQNNNYEAEQPGSAEAEILSEEVLTKQVKMRALETYVEDFLTESPENWGGVTFVKETRTSQDIVSQLQPMVEVTMSEVGAFLLAKGFKMEKTPDGDPAWVFWTIWTE